ncbi:MAG: class I cytochrome c [Acidobacteria bacterium]|nr:MAG: class I cytochrome c [Acidobacteriota bacterium]
MFAGQMKIKVKVTVVVIIGFVIVMLNPSFSAQQPDNTSRSVWDGVYTKEQVKRGEKLYAQLCSSCHGQELAGNDEAAPLSGPAFQASWEGLSVGELSNRVRVSMPPNDPGTLSRQQIVDILSYVLSVNGFPSGKTELDSKPEVLKQVRIEAIKPKEKSG